MIVQLVHSEYGVRELNLDFEHDDQFTLMFHVNEDVNIPLIQLMHEGKRWHAWSTKSAHVFVNGTYQEEVLLQFGCTAAIKVQNQAENLHFLLLCFDFQQLSKVPFIIHCPNHSELTVGYEGCNINYAAPFISEKHAKIISNDGILSIHDTNSSNGVYVNQQRINQHQFKFGDLCDLFGLRIICLGEYLIVADLTGSGALSFDHVQFQRQKNNEHQSFEAKQYIHDKQNEIRFDRMPRIWYEPIMCQETIDAAPTPQPREEMPLMLTIGSSAIMSMSSIMMAVISLQNIQNSGANPIAAVPSMLMALSMFSGSLLMPIINRKYTQKKQMEREADRQKRYKAYLNDIDVRVTRAAEEQKTLLVRNYSNVEILSEQVKRLDDRMWERMTSHKDFLYLRLGSADQDFEPVLKIPAERFNLDDDVMRDALYNLKQKHWVMNDVPLMLPLKNVGLLGIVATQQERITFAVGLLTQLCCTHGYDDVKVGLIYPANEEEQWEFAHWFPHTWTEDRSQHLIATDGDGLQLLSAHIRSYVDQERHSGSALEQKKHIVVFVADEDMIDRCEGLRDAIVNKRFEHLSVIVLTNRSLPKECDSVITLREGLGQLYEHIDQMKEPVLFHLDHVPVDAVRDVATKMSNIRMNVQKENSLPDTVSFYEMLHCGRVEHLHAWDRWLQSDPVKTLAAPLGMDQWGELLELDIHQNAHGPHGLIAGMTGSGKSELIISYLLSMAVHYSPLEVSFLLIDYKGGGMSDTLKQLPHVVGTIDNLGGKQGIHRSMVCINSELRRRQAVFKDITEQKGVSNLDIYRYQRMFRAGEVDEPMPHLLIVSDEFAELKQQEPDFMDDLISAARIGRSLGVHLLLATQKPTGVVNEQITSNARFKICMKVQDRSDSNEMIGRPDAALLTQTGRFYLQVGFNEIFTVGQSAWSGADDEEKDKFEKRQDLSIEVLNDHGRVIQRVNPQKLQRDQRDKKKQVNSIVTYLHNVAEEHNTIPAPLWKRPLNEYEHLCLEWMHNKYDCDELPWSLKPVVGLVDDPYNQEQYPLQLDFKADGHILIYGVEGSGKDEFINTMIADLCAQHSPEEVNIYCIDLAGETTRMFAAMPHVGEVMVSGEDEKIVNFVDMLEKEVALRRKKLAVYGGDIQAYRNDVKDFFPDIVVVVHNYTAFAEGFEPLSDRMVRIIREGTRFGIYFVITAAGASSVRYRLTQNFRQVFCMQMADAGDYRTVLGVAKGIEPSGQKGNGVYVQHDNVVTFQVADILSDTTVPLFKTVQHYSAERAAAWRGNVAPRVPVMPDVVSVNEICTVPETVQLNAVPVGISIATLENVTWNLSERDVYLVAYESEPEIPFVSVLIRILAASTKRSVLVFDAGKQLPKSSYTQYAHYCTQQEMIEGFGSLLCETYRRHSAVRAAEAARQPLPSFDEMVVCIVGGKEFMGSFPEEMDNPNEEYRTVEPRINCKEYLDKVLKCIRKDLNMTILVATDTVGARTLDAHEWYKDRMSGKHALWIGDGFSGQWIMETQNIRHVDIKQGVLYRKGKAMVCRLLEE